MELGDRKKRILQAIVSDYIETAEPVGSRSIARKHITDLSPATIRNEMADLEEMGYLIQPHSSAGRVPSVSGYRAFVDSLMNKYKLSMAEMVKMQEILGAKVRELDDLIERASHVLATVTNYAAVAIAPERKRNSVKTIQIVPVNSLEFVLVIVTNEGIVKNRLIRLKNPVKADDVYVLSSQMTGMLAGLTLNEINLETINNIKTQFADFSELINEVIDFIGKVIGEIDAREIVVDGGVNLLKFPEYANVEKAKEMLELLENKEQLQDIITLPALKENKVNIIIGDEENGLQLKDCSVVLCNYNVNGDAGTIGVIGPTRMDYAKVVSAIEYMCQGIGRTAEDEKEGKEEKRDQRNEQGERE